MIDISKAFDTFNRTVASFFQEPGLGFYIPLYQREYSWDAENVNQFMEDICQGVGNLMMDNQEIRFLGTVIRVKENNPRVNINPRDTRAFPTRIDNVIDGQQRISTIALLGALLYQRLTDVGSKLPKTGPFAVVHDEILSSKLKALLELFTVDLQRGNPARKPIVIRGSVDTWTLDGEDDPNYRSEVAAYLANVIRAIQDRTELPRLQDGSLVGKNLRLMNKWLSEVESRHRDQTDEAISFPTAWEILEQTDIEVQLWNYEREELREIVKNLDDKSKNRDYLCSIVQLLIFTYYLLERCCFNVIDPISENWAFDMFQSLNATGTPLTAIETFKPMVVNRIISEGGEYKNSRIAEYFANVDTLFANESSAAQKAKLTSEYLTALAHTVNGTKLPQRFSSQRKWLNDTFVECMTPVMRDEYLRRMSDLAIYLRNVLQYDETIPFFPNLEALSVPEQELATLCILYLQDSGHKMAHTILSRFYAQVLRKQPNAQPEFLAACKATAAFYTLWRSASSNSGLDNAYRQILKGGVGDKSGEELTPLSWESSTITSEHLKRCYREVLESEKRKIGTYEDWKKKAVQYFRFDNARPVCRFALFVVAQDTIEDNDKFGLMKIGTLNSTPPFLTPSLWRVRDLRTVEHIAPQTQTDKWDDSLYQKDDYQRIGNLTLLPVDVNSSAGNRDWREKWIYYMHLAEKDPSKVAQLKELARTNGVELNDDTVTLLKNTSHKDHMKSIVNIGMGGIWDLALVEQRTDRICEILWTRLYNWLT